jgi:peptidoglycan/xylan/chitin deacetylase (PgdA/CDA1 family)
MDLRPRLGFLAFVLALLAPPFASAKAGKVALTIDDLPVFGSYSSAAQGREIVSSLIAGLQRNHLRAIGFVNEIQLDAPDRPQRIALLHEWLDGGVDLGNHSYSHKSLTSTPVEAYIADVAKGERVTGALLAERGKRERWYRYPYLETGTSVAVRRRFEGWLASHHYRVAPVSMENSDWEFAEPYADAIARGDHAEAAHIRDAYLDYTREIVPWYQGAARGLLGKEPAFVFLIHASRLNADSMDALAAILRTDRLRSVTLARAMKDPAYRIVDSYVGADGDEWLTRWSLTLKKSLPYNRLPQVPGDVAALDAKIENGGSAPMISAGAH